MSIWSVFLFVLAASPLNPSRLIALRALVIIHMVQADTLQADTRSTPCSQPLRSSVTHGIGTVTDIPDKPYDLYICRFLRATCIFDLGNKPLSLIIFTA